MSSYQLRMLIASIVLAMVGTAFLSGFFYGRNLKREQEWQQTIKTFYERQKIDEITFKLDNRELCVALGGLRERCAELLRRLDKAATGK